MITPSGRVTVPTVDTVQLFDVLATAMEATLHCKDADEAMPLFYEVVEKKVAHLKTDHAFALSTRAALFMAAFWLEQDTYVQAGLISTDGPHSKPMPRFVEGIAKVDLVFETPSDEHEDLGLRYSPEQLIAIATDPKTPAPKVVFTTTLH